MPLNRLLPFYLLVMIGQYGCSGSPEGHSTPVEPSITRRTVSGAPGNIYDREDWQFDAGSPVRSSPALDNGKLYFGTAAGELLALDADSGKLQWRYDAGSAIHSSPSVDGRNVYFTSNEQKLFAIDKLTGRQQWVFPMPGKLPYPWRFDYYYSSPYLYDSRIFTGSDNGKIYALAPSDGKELWSFDCGAVVRSTPVVSGSLVLAGDCQGRMHALDLETGKERWHFSTHGDTLNNDRFGFDRKAILASAVVAGGRILFGCRDGFLYCLDSTGSLQWTVDHQVSWIVSTVAVQDSVVVTGTSDGRFVQAVNLYSGREIWKYRPNTLFWSSPLIAGGMVYIGGFDGQVHIIDLHTGRRVSQFQTGGTVLSSPVADSSHLFAGSDDGKMYALRARNIHTLDTLRQRRLVYYDPEVKVYFRSGSDRIVRDYMVSMGYREVGSDSINAALQQDPQRTSIVFASDYFPPGIYQGGRQSVLRRFLDGGGRVILTGTNPLMYRMDPLRKTAIAFADTANDQVFDLDYGAHDTRAFGGQFPVFATRAGLDFGLPSFWVASLFRSAGDHEIILGKNENGLVSSFIRFYENNGSLIQIYLDPVRPDGLDVLPALAEWRLERP